MGHDVWEVRGALAVTLRLSRVLGAAPLRLQARGATLHARVSKAYALYGIVFVTLLNITVIVAFLLDMTWNVGNYKRMVRGGTKEDLIMWLLDVTVTQSFATFAAYSGHSRMTSLVYHFNRLKEATAYLHTDKKKKQKREKKRTIICIVLSTLHYATVVFVIIYTAESARSEDKEVLVGYLYGAYNICYIIGAVVGDQLLFLICEIHAAMESLNEELEWILFNIHETRPLNKAEEDSLRRIAVLYDTISVFIRRFNNHDGALIFLKFIIFNIYLMFTFYNFYDSLLRSVAEGYSIVFDFMFLAIWCFIHVIGMAVFVEPCHQTLKEVDKCRVLLSDLMYRSQPPGAPSSLCVDVLYKQLVLDTFSFTPLGVCTLTRSLFTTYVSSLTTCSVVVVQYRLADIASNKGK